MKYSLSKNIIVFLCLLAFFPGKIVATPADRFSADKAYQHIKVLSQKIGPRPAGSKGEVKAAQYISYTLEQYGWKVNEQPFSKIVVHDNSLLNQEQRIELINSQNIIAELPGQKPDSIVIGAHYDTAGINVPGALDNASGVGVLLELARLLSQEKNEFTYQLVFFGAEESGLVGSSYYTTQADLSAVNWMLNIDMVGTPLEIDVAGKKSAPRELIKQATLLARKNKIPFHVSRDFIVMTRDSTQGGTSDFSPFLDQGVPAFGVGIAGRQSGFFHRPEDGIEHVSLSSLDKVGNYICDLVKTVNMKRTGPQTWDDNYLTFQISSYVFILPSIGIRIFVFLTFLITIVVLFLQFKKGLKPKLKSLLQVIVILSLICLVVVALSGSGEFIWHISKSSETLWYAHPGLFLLARVLTAVILLIAIGSLYKALPLPREPGLYWLVGVNSLLIAGFLAVLIRVDLAFPILFWLLCYIIQWYVPSFIFVMIGPYFFMRFHWELLNSQQWFSFYDTVNRFFLPFLIVYTILLFPLLAAALHVISHKSDRWHKVLITIRRPALVLLVGIILGLGLIPAYNQNYRQPVTVREEWIDNTLKDTQVSGRYHIFSPEILPKQIAQEFNGERSKSITFPVLKIKPPLNVDAMVSEHKDNNRILDLGFNLNFIQEPYLLRVKFESPHPFQITQTDEFFPIAKLPKKVQLQGKQQVNGKYGLILERTPPQRNHMQMTVAAQGTIKCTIEGIFPDLAPHLNLNYPYISVEYELVTQTSFEF